MLLASHDQHARGFTLIELLVVILIISILAGMTTLSIGGLDARRLQREAAVLSLTFNHLMDRALMKQENFQWLYNPEERRCDTFVADSEGEWQPMVAEGKNSCDLEFIKEMTIIYPDQANSDSGFSEKKGSVFLDDVTSNAVYFYASGEYTPFDLSLTDLSGNGFMLSGDGINSIVIKPLTP